MVIDFDKLVGTKLQLKLPIHSKGLTFTEAVVSHYSYERDEWHLQLRPHRVGYMHVVEFDVHGVGRDVDTVIDEPELRFTVPLSWTRTEECWHIHFTGLPMKKTPEEELVEGLNTALADSARRERRAESDL